MFQPIEENVSVYKKVVAQIQEMIMHGELKKGDRLPPERQLAEMLEVLGIIRSRQGDGNYITADTVEVINPLAMQFYLKNGKMDDILEFRYIMEVQMASLAAAKITEEEIGEFQALMDSMKEAIAGGADLKTRQYYNNLFHFRVVNLSGNQLIRLIYSSIMDLVSDQIRQTDGMYFYESHLKIFEAIKNRNPKEAAYYMAEHFQNKFPNYQYYMDVHAL